MGSSGDNGSILKWLIPLTVAVFLAEFFVYGVQAFTAVANTDPFSIVATFGQFVTFSLAGIPIWLTITLNLMVTLPWLYIVITTIIAIIP